MLPDGPPLLGASRQPGVWFNLGHGSSGWALACGSARLVADLIAGREPAIDTRGLPITVLSVADLLGQAIVRINSNESVTNLFRVKGF